MPERFVSADNGIRTMWIPIDIDSGPQEAYLGDAKVLLITEGPEGNKSLNVYYEVDTRSYEEHNNTCTVFYVIGVAEQVPEGARHVGSVLLRDGNVFHIYEERKEKKFNA